MSEPIPDSDIVGAAVALVTAHGFVTAMSGADAMIAEWAVSTAPEAAEGLAAWRRIRAAIDELERRRV